MIEHGDYFHVTSVNRIDDIATRGINPKFSEGKRNVMWYVSRENVPGAILHVAARHQWLVGNMAICVVEFWPFEIIHTAWPGVYCTGLTRCPHTILGVGDFIPKWKE